MFLILLIIDEINMLLASLTHSIFTYLLKIDFLVFFKTLKKRMLKSYQAIKLFIPIIRKIFFLPVRYQF
jgi:hypothetical protein